MIAQTPSASDTSLGLKFLSAAVFILAAVPRLNLSIGPVPLYAIDICLLGAFIYGGLHRPSWLPRAPGTALVIAILVFALFSELIGLLAYMTILETPYMTGRMILAVSLFFSLNNLIRTEDDLFLLLKAATVGMLVTAFLMAATSLPVARGSVSWLFGINVLSPVGEGFFDVHAETDRGVRGQSLVGYNIISGWFVCLLWPLALALYQNSATKGLWKKISLASCILAPFGILFSYSRGAILGMVLLVAALLTFGEGRLKVQMTVILVVFVGVIGLAGLDSNLFFFERLERRTKATLEAPFSDERESERFRSYSEPFAIIISNPLYLIAGEGLTKMRAGRRGYLKSTGINLFRIEGNPADHSVFAMATYTYGMLAAFCYLGLYATCLKTGFYEASLSKRNGGLGRSLPQLAFASLFAITAWIAFDKGIIQQPRGLMMFLFVMALAGISRNLRLSNQQMGHEEGMLTYETAFESETEEQSSQIRGRDYMKHNQDK